MPLETGTWTINTNGSVGQLTINAVDTSGNLSAIFLLSGTPTQSIQGFWDETSQKITFYVLGIGAVQVYTGFLFQDQFRITGVTGSVVFMLAGYFQLFGKYGDLVGIARRNLFGWYAQIGLE